MHIGNGKGMGIGLKLLINIFYSENQRKVLRTAADNLFQFKSMLLNNFK